MERVFEGCTRRRVGPGRIFLLLVLAVGSPGCVFFELRDALTKTHAGLEHTNRQLQATASQISDATRTLGEQAVPAMNSTASAIRDAKEGMAAAASLAEPMREMRSEMQAMRGDLSALKSQLAEASALVPALQKVGELREPMQRVAALRDSMNNVAALNQPMTDLQGLRVPMQNVAELREPLLATGQLVDPMRALAKESQGMSQTSGGLGRTVALYAGLALVLWTLATAFGVWLGLRFSK
jgi:hypothetical protein